jgi:hypothetical protein
VGNLRKVVREADPVPAGLGPDYEGLTFAEPIQYWVNGSGRVLFFISHNDATRALWMEQPDGSLRPVVKEFTTLDVMGDGSDIRLISSLTVLGTSAASGDGRRTLFNDADGVVVRISFTDGSEGVFTTAPAPTPPCAADFNGDTLLNPDDLSEFITCFFLQLQFPGACPQADFNGDQLLNPDDLSEFITAFFLAVQFGC